MPPLQPDEDQPIEAQAQDNQSPFQPSDPIADGDGQITDLSDDHPATDSDLDTTELYNEGVSGAAEAEDPETRISLDDEAL